MITNIIPKSMGCLCYRCDITTDKTLCCCCKDCSRKGLSPLERDLRGKVLLNDSYLLREFQKAKRRKRVTRDMSTLKNSMLELAAKFDDNYNTGLIKSFMFGLNKTEIKTMTDILSRYKFRDSHAWDTYEIQVEEHKHTIQKEYRHLLQTMMPAYIKKGCTAFHSRRESDESPTSFPDENTIMPYSGFKPEPTRLQTEGHIHHTGWAAFFLKC
ncbi:hypothetical protein TNCV_4659321 [Trichonephila clavipes]|nr:hypothetical protein TNCV_4659321 [Trichonephila clavipes]